MVNLEKQMSDTKNYNRRTFLGNTLQAGGFLVLSQNVSIFAKSNFVDYKDTLIMKTQTVEESIAQYFRAWNEKGVKNIQATLEKCWTADVGTYTDPNNPPIKGLEGLAMVIQGSQDKMPERKIELISKVDCHDNSGRYEWRLTKQNGEKSEGLDYFEYDSENQITRIVSFFGALALKH